MELQQMKAHAKDERARKLVQIENWWKIVCSSFSVFLGRKRETGKRKERSTGTGETKDGVGKKIVDITRTS